MRVLRCNILEVEVKISLILLLLLFALPMTGEEQPLFSSYQVKDIIAGKVPNGEHVIYGLLYSDKELFLFQGLDSFNYMWASDEMITLSSNGDFRALHGCYVSVRGAVGYIEQNNRYYIHEIESIERAGIFDLLAEGEKEPLCIVPALIEIMKR